MKTKLNYLALSVFFSLAILSSCQDPPPNVYIPDVYVQGYLIVGEPLRKIVIMQTQSIADTFNYKKSLIRNASVKITGDGKTFNLIINSTGTEGYYYPDTTYLVKPSMEYNLEVTLNDGKIMKGHTFTNANFSWVKTTSYYLQFPFDTLNYVNPDSLKIYWTRPLNYFFGYYLLSLRCLDTLDYGKYYGTNKNEKNRRIVRPWTEDNYFHNITSWGLIPNLQAPVVWSAFKWFGLQEVSIYAPDMNMLEWFIQTIAKNQYDPNLNSIVNGKGVFGSASVIRDTIFVIKNQP